MTTIKPAVPQPHESLYNTRIDESAWWSTTNVGEADPGVLSPLNWSIKERAGERAIRRAFAGIGVLERARTGVPHDDNERFIGVFYGRIGAKVDHLAEMGDRLPGTSGAAVAEQILGRLPDSFETHPTRRRYPIIALRLPVTSLTVPRRMRNKQARTAEWWTAEIARTPRLDFEEARQQFTAAVGWYEEVMTLHLMIIFAVVQPVYEQVRQLAIAVGAPELADRALTGQGSHAELAVVEDLWRLSRGTLSLERFLAVHGYHGPYEGELASTVWREDPRPVELLASRYRDMPDSMSPVAVAAQQAAEGQEAHREFVQRLPRSRQGIGRLVLHLANRNIPLRGVGKVAFLQSIDVARSAARRCGEHLVTAGVLDDAQDVFYLTVDELAGISSRSGSMSTTTSSRRQERARLETLEIPKSWRGYPEPISPAPPAADRQPSVTHLTGTGASPGVVEGRVRVVVDPTYDDVEVGEILVAPFTDPSWATVLFMSSAMVVDMGGLLSHAAVVARELGVPCVMGTGNGTQVLHTGDLCRVDGNAGTIEVLEAAGSPSCRPTA